MSAEKARNRRAFDVVLFDLGSTLIYFDADWGEVLGQSQQYLAETLRAAGHSLDVLEFTRLFGERIQAYYSERDTEFIEHTTEYILKSTLGALGIPEMPKEELKDYLTKMYAVSEVYWRREEDALETLQTLQDQGYRLGIISNAGDAQNVQRLIDQAGLRQYFEYISISADVGIRKPHPRIFQMAFDHFRVEAGRAVMIGDTLGADVLGARNVSMASVWITRRADTPDNRAHRDTLRPDAEISTLAELPPLLEDWSSAKELSPY